MTGHVVRAGMLPAANTIVALAGKKYGWPQVAGFRDDRGYVHPGAVLEFSSVSAERRDPQP